MDLATDLGSEERLDAAIAQALVAWRPPPRLRLSEWADRYFYLSAESAAEPGRWRTLPYQRGIMDAITDPSVERVSVMKSARVGYTKMFNAAIGYFMHQDPCPVLVVQPAVEDAEGYSKEEIAPMLADCPELGQLLVSDGPKAKNSNNTILHKKFRGGGLLAMAGANSGRAFRRVSRRVVIFDEPDIYPASSGTEGDPISLGIRRTEYYWNRKIIMGSTPVLAGVSRIEAAFLEGDQRRYYVPCPQCGHMDILVFRKEAERGHWMQWPEGKPEEAHFVCRKNGCVIEHHQKRAMVAAGEWRAEAHFKGHASFHIWAAYSFSPNATWGQIAEEFIAAEKKGPDVLKTFVNTVLGETWIEKGDAPEWKRLYDRRETYTIGTVPVDALFLTAGVDVQKDRLVYEVTAWGEDKQSWTVEAGILPGDTSSLEPWAGLDDLLNRGFPSPDGTIWHIKVMAVDSGYNTNAVYSWCKRYPIHRVIAAKGVSTQRTMLGAPSKVEVTLAGRRVGYRVWPVGVDLAKSEFYGWLRLERPTRESGELFPPGYCHHPELGEDFFKQITAEHLVKITKRTGHAVYEWQVLPGRENHWLDCRVYARAAATHAGLDRIAARRVPRRTAPAAPTPRPPTPAIKPAELRVDAPRPSPRPGGRGGWLGGRGGRGSWLKGR